MARRRRWTGCRRSQSGQVLPLVALLVVACGLACVLVARVGAAAIDRGRAKAAADAAALAGAADGREAARAVAAANGGRLVSFQRDGDEVSVRVRLGQAAAGARAVQVGTPVAATGSTAGMAPAMRAALARAAQLLGGPVPITSGFRSRAQQEALWRRRATNPYPVAPPGSSMHERGLAVDVPAAFAERLAAVARQAGLCRPYPRSDPVHFELCRPG